jgi:hypothetical protein
MSRAQILFAIGLGTVTLVVVAVGAYVLSSATWGTRWYRRRDERGDRGEHP